MIRLLSLLFLFLLLGHSISASTSEKRRPTQAELEAVLNDGLELYQLELASSYASSFLDAQLSTEDLGGYFSYREGDTIRTLFYESGKKNAKVRYTFAFVLPVTPSFAYLRGTKRKMTSKEKSLFRIRQRILKMADKEPDFFGPTVQAGLNLNLLERSPGWVAYLTPAITNTKVIPLGNDYQLFFSTKGKLLHREKLHQNLITINTSTEGLPESEDFASMHIHSNESSDLITPTDICQLLLFKDHCSWVDHYVITNYFVCHFNLATQQLVLMTQDEFRALQMSDQ